MGIASLVLRSALHAYSLILLVWVLLSWFHPAANRWTVLIGHMVEPVLEPVRRVLRRVLPARAWIVDWSPLAVFLAIQAVCRLLRFIR
ncbi:MAG: YggT family protein [Clostridia bacterium]|nr:YggT family protein [Clostridia bacterium]